MNLGGTPRLLRTNSLRLGVQYALCPRMSSSLPSEFSIRQFETDHLLTAINPKVTQDNLDTTICKAGDSKSIRPPRAITDAEKRASAAAYGYTGALSDVEFDHVIGIEDGGDPNDARNLWPEPGASPNPKDAMESRMHELICSRKVSLAAAQQAIAADWTSALSVVG